MAEFRVHRFQLFKYTPNAIHCMAYSDNSQRLAVSRSDSSVEIWSVKDNWFQEKLIPSSPHHSIEALVWCQGRLFSAGLSGDIIEYDLLRLRPKNSSPSNGGATWCLATNDAQTQLAAGTEDGCIVIFDLTEEGLMYERMLDKQEGRILSIAWHDTEDRIITGGIDNIRIWSVTSGHAVQRLTLGRQHNSKETIVWCVAVTSNMTIISGDSRGKTCFWNGKQGTLIKSYQSHKADVLCLCVNKAGTSVFTGGVDPALVQFEYAATQDNSDWKMWVRSSVRNQHKHDIRALAYAGHCVVSGGVDCSLICNSLEKTGGKKSTKHWHRLPPLPHRHLVHVAKEANVVMLQYPEQLDLWRLGTTNKTSEVNGEILPLKTNPVKLLQLLSKNGETIVCSAISPNAQWIAYSDTDRIRLFQISIDDGDIISPTLSINRVRYLPPAVLPAHHLHFTSGRTKLVSATTEGSVQVLIVDSVQPTLACTLTKGTDNVSPIHLLCSSQDGSMVATGDNQNDVCIYSLKKNKVLCHLPKYSYQPSAISFSPDNSNLVVAYTDQKIMEYNIAHKEYTAWSRQFAKHLHPQWLRRQSKINRISFNPTNHEQIIVADEQMFCILDKTQPFPPPDVHLYKKSTWQQGQGHVQGQLEGRRDKDGKVIKHCFHICNKYKYLLCLETLNDDWLVVVERSQADIMDSLPPALKQKKFGT